MSRSAVRVRPAEVGDLPVLLDLAADLREAQQPLGEGRGRAVVGAGSRAALEARYLAAIDDVDRHLVLAVAPDDTALGMALLTVDSTSALLDQSAVHLSHSVVPDRHRRRGVGRALVAYGAAFAEERGIEQIVVSVAPGSRESNRFFARLGFAPVAVRRVAPVAAVRRHLGIDTRTADHVVRAPRRPVRRGRTLPLGRRDSD